MDFTYETQGNNTYLVYELSETDQIDSMSLGMLTNNKIPGLASTIFTQMNTERYVKYNVSSKISAKQFFSSQVNKKRLVGVFKGIVDAMIYAEEYMIDTSSVLLDFEYIFSDVSTCETTLICVPLEGFNNETDLATFFKGIMFSTQFDQSENCDYIAKIINYLNSTTMFSASDFKDLLVDIEGANKQQIAEPVNNSAVVSQPVVQTSQPTVSVSVAKQPEKNVTNIETPVNNLSKNNQNIPADKENVVQEQKKKGSVFGLFGGHKKEPKQAKDPKNTKGKKALQNEANAGFAIPGQPQPSISKPQVQAQPQVQANIQPQVQSLAQPVAPQPHIQPMQSQPANFGETTVLNAGAIGETTVLNAVQQQANQITPHIIRENNNEKISINKPVFRIGKERSYVDYFIGDNTTISRSHANIISREGEYYITDTNSTNHTYVNGQMISSNVEVKLEHGTRFMLSNENFEFRLY